MKAQVSKQAGKGGPTAAALAGDTGHATGPLLDGNQGETAQLRLSEAANRSSRVAQLRAMQERLNRSAGKEGATGAVQMAKNTSIEPARPTAPETNRTGLPDRLKAGVETLSGLSMDDVRVHYNSSRPAQLQALAYTQGSDIHVGPGQERHLAHEAWHVVQQKQGRVRPTVQLRGVEVNDDGGLEREAERMAVHAKQAPATTTTRPFISQPPLQMVGKSVVQRVMIDVRYNHGQGRLRIDTKDLAKKNLDYFITFPGDAYDAITAELDGIQVHDENELQDIQRINELINEARPINAFNRNLDQHTRKDVTVSWAGDTATGYIGDTEVASFEFCDYDDDGRMWIWNVETSPEYQKQGIGTTMLANAVKRYGAVYAAKASKLELDPDDEGDDTRWLSGEGASLVNSALRKGVMKQEWFINPLYE